MKLWQGRFSENSDKLMDIFNSSLPFDRRLFVYDITGSLAHVKMLSKCGIIEEEDCKKITQGLLELKNEYLAGSLVLEGYEDVHMAVEELLTKKIGVSAKKMHTARSRNDQVALDIRLYTRDAIDEIVGMLKSLIHTLLNIASENTQTLMPSYTHLQKAQCSTLAHYLLCYCSMFIRDIDRLVDAKKRVNICPLGAGALACCSFEINREMVAEELGFDGVCQNSIDAVSDRDFIIEVTSSLATVMMHLSRFCEETIIYSSEEFSYFVLSDKFSTGSSMMPQKKNPDAAELIRGKTGRVYGALTSILTLMKGLPLAYNKDMQEDKEMFFDAVDTVRLCLEVFEKMFAAMEFNKEKMEQSVKESFMSATDVAEYLVRKGLPFRDCHFVVGNMVKDCIAKGIYLFDLSLAELKEYSSLFSEDVFSVTNGLKSIYQKAVTGSPKDTETKKVIDKYYAYIK